VNGGTVTGTQLFVGNQGENSTGAPTGTSTVNITGGTTTFSGYSYIGHSGKEKLGGKGVLNVSGGSIRFNARTAVGYDLNGDGTVQITGGTVYGPNADFLLGEGNSLGKMTVNGGTYNQNNKGNLVIWSTTAVDENGNMGSRLELKSGTIDTNWLSLGQSGVAGGTCTFDMTGGILKVGSGSQNFRIGQSWHATANISGGNITVNGTVIMGEHGGTGVLNVYGSDSTWDVKAVDWRATGTANFVAKALTFQDDGTGKTAISTITTRSGATVASHIGVDMSDYYYTGAGFLTNLPTQQLLTAQSLTWNPASVTVKGDWVLTTENNTVGLTLDETKIAMADVTSGSGIASGILGTRGWVQILGEADSVVSLLMFYGGEGDGDLLAEWLTDQLDETQQDITITNTGSFIEFGNLLLNADGMGYLSYNIDAFNALHDMNLTFTNVPEPSTWGLMLLGLAFIFWKRGFWRKS
ncbi:MAG: PEP-CTERM sorting domain-containing protein, partial [Planctomycetia bacterium]|nr:PEP-CTERM sorting domain-containing protein [Planctomycetia bacterium]